MSSQFLLVAYYLDYKSNKKVEPLPVQKKEVLAYIAKKNREYACSNNLYTGSVYNKRIVLANEFIEQVNNKTKLYPQLELALDYCKRHKAELIVPQIMPVYRNAVFSDLLLKYKIPFYCLEVSTLNLKSLQTVLDMYTIMKKRKSVVIKNALRAARKPLGNPNALQEISKVNKPKRENAIMFSILLTPIIDYYRSAPQNYSQREIVRRLNNNGFSAPEGGKWVLSQIQKVLERIDMNNFVMSISKELEYYKKRDYTNKQILQALCELDLSMPGKKTLDELFIDEILERHQMLSDITAFNAFIAKYYLKILTYFKQGADKLTSFAKELNVNQVPIPKRIEWEYEFASCLNNKEKRELRYWTAELLQLTLSMSERRKEDIAKIVNIKILEESSRLMEQAAS